MSAQAELREALVSRGVLTRAAEAERAILHALNHAYQLRVLEHVHFSPAYDVTVARLAAIDVALADVRAKLKGVPA